MKKIDEIRKLAELLIPYNPYNNTLFPGQRESEISGFIKGYIQAQKDFEEKTSENDQNQQI
jgi:hypothetical protein